MKGLCACETLRKSGTWCRPGTATKRPQKSLRPHHGLETSAKKDLMMRKAQNAHESIGSSVPVALTIAGSDSGGGAGIQADLKTFAACGVFGCSAITALTAQNTHGVSGIQTVPRGFLRQQLDAVLDDFPVSVIKTGVLPDIEAVREVAHCLGRWQHIPVIVDPVMVATSGDSLTSSAVVAAVAEQLFPLATVVTPNLIEAAALLKTSSIKDLEGMKAAAVQLLSMGCKYVFIKGGHLKGTSELADVLYDGRNHLVLTGPKVQTGNSHGTGCTIASAIAAFIAQGMGVEGAVKAGKDYITEALKQSSHIALGSGKQKPFNHMFQIDDWRANSPLDLRVYGVTDPDCNRTNSRTNAEAVEAALAGGATIIQLREKSADGLGFYSEAQSVLEVARPKGVKVLINDRVDIALAVGADGAHVGQGDIPASAARRLLGRGKVLGVSVKTVEQARQAEAAGADYLGAGAMHPTPTKESSRISHETLSAICKAVKIPVIAIGGITADNTARCIGAGCAGVAVVSAIFGAADPSQAAREIREVVDATLKRD